ncbi:uncharacterized protein LOC113497540 [Trichoplusia ni]|uniref:Uncharacterized protein LOC113497540 n=1 Tax=Trichoplusia ni TaxID=7111 RepID=A0A7E5VX64_TRINI|nr:uncharacterized protein LOC113497540 [Trichoplusia ni]
MLVFDISARRKHLSLFLNWFIKNIVSINCVIKMVLTGTIVFEKDVEEVYKAGQSVTGILKYSVDKPTEFASIYISLVGKGRCSWTLMNANPNIPPITLMSNKSYVYLTKNLVDETNNKGPQNGNYEYPFDFILPSDIPSSYKDKYVTIAYKISVKFEIRNIVNSLEKIKSEIKVCGNVKPCSPEPFKVEFDKKVFAVTKRKRVDIEATIEKTLVAPGEDLTVSFLVNNDSSVPLNIKTELFEHLTYEASGRYYRFKNPVKSTARYSPSIKKKDISKITCTVPTFPKLYSIQHAELFTLEYRIHITVVFPFPHRNATVDVPVVIGETEDLLECHFLDNKEPSISMIFTERKNEESLEKNSDYERRGLGLGYTERMI